MKSEIWLIIFMFFVIYGFGQDKIILKSGQVYEGKIIENTDTTVVIKTQVTDKDLLVERDLIFFKDKIKKVEISMMKDENRVAIKLKSGQVIKGRLVVEKDGEVTVDNLKGSKMTSMTIPSNQIQSMKLIKNSNGLAAEKTVFFDMGLIRGGALFGGEVEFAVSPNSTFYIGGGFKGYAVGMNIFFRENYRGPAIKLSYLHIGIGETYSAGVLSGGLSMKMRPGLSMDLGIGYIIEQGNYNYIGQDIILTYGIGYRF